jgi:hypothetical protein
MKQERSTSIPPNSEERSMTQLTSPNVREVEGNVYRIPTAFGTRVRSAIITLAKREAREAIKRKLRAEGRREALFSASESGLGTRLANLNI